LDAGKVLEMRWGPTVGNERWDIGFWGAGMQGWNSAQIRYLPRLVVESDFARYWERNEGTDFIQSQCWWSELQLIVAVYERDGRYGRPCDQDNRHGFGITPINIYRWQM
jgi:hypothetical protein